MTSAPVTDPGEAASYAERVARHVPGLWDLHRMAGLLLAEHVPDAGRVLVLGAGAGWNCAPLPGHIRAGVSTAWIRRPK